MWKFLFFFLICMKSSGMLFNLGQIMSLCVTLNNSEIYLKLQSIFKEALPHIKRKKNAFPSHCWAQLDILLKGRRQNITTSSVIVWLKEP